MKTLNVIHFYHNINRAEFPPLPPSVVSTEVGEGDDLAAEEDFHAVVELLAESVGGEPEEFRKDSGVDDRSLFGFDQGDGNLRAEGEQVLSERALEQCPIIG